MTYDASRCWSVACLSTNTYARQSAIDLVHLRAPVRSSFICVEERIALKESTFVAEVSLSIIIMPAIKLVGHSKAKLLCTRVFLLF